MPTALPAVLPPDYSQTLNAYRVGAQDKVGIDKRNLMKEAGGLAAAGNMKGAMSKLYSGGEFDEARGVSGEMRAQSAESRAMASHARTMANDQLERAAKGHELLGRLVPAIGNDPQKLEMAKTLLKQRGFDFSNVTLDQLPLLQQQNISISDQLNREMQQRQFEAEQNRAGLTQFNTDRSFNEQRRQFEANQLDEAAKLQIQAQKDKLAQDNANRDFGLKQDELGVKRDALSIAQSRAKAAADKASAPKPLTEGQAAATYFGKSIERAENNLMGTPDKPGILAGDAETPMSSYTNSVLSSAPNSILYRGFSSKQKQFAQAAMQFIRAKLRKESGATIAPSEFAGEYVNLFPQPGDDVQTRRQKAEYRREVIQGFKTMGGAVPDNQPASGVGDLSDDDILKGLNFN